MGCVFFLMSKASCIFVAYSELPVRKTLKSFESVLFSLQFWHILKCSRIADFVLQMFLNPSAKMSRSHTDA